MKHFTITSNTEAAALRPFASEPLKVGHIVTPCAGRVTHTAWDNYPEADALTFEQCMAVVRVEVTGEVLHELGKGESFRTDSDYGFDIEKGQDVSIVRTSIGNVFMVVFISNDIGHASIKIPNPTATKIKLLAAILRGEDI